MASEREREKDLLAQIFVPEVKTKSDLFLGEKKKAVKEGRTENFSVYSAAKNLLPTFFKKKEAKERAQNK